MPTDTGAVSPTLRALGARLWGEDTGGPVVVTTGELPLGYVAAESYVALPSLQNARFLVPAGAPRAVAAAFTRHLTTVSTGSRLSGRLIAGAFRSGLGERVARGRLTVGIDGRIPHQQWREHLVLAELAHRLETPALVGIHPVRRATPNAKPTVRLFDRDGHAAGYAKIGWSPPTRRLVKAEVHALTALDGRVGTVQVPRVLAEGRWTPHDGLDLNYVVTTALPPGLRGWPGTPESDAEVLRAIAATGSPASGPLAGSPYAASVRARLDRARDAQPAEVRALETWFDRLLHAGAELEMGRWHGDWVAWNMAATSVGGAVWDWEYSAPSVPLGFDVCHWYFQTRLAAADGTLDRAAAELDTRLSALGALGVPREAWRLVGDLYVLEMLLRATCLASEGSGWNPKLHPRLIGFAREHAVR